MVGGIVAAVLAALAWSLNFVVPFVIGEYSIFDFALLRFIVSGIVGACFLGFRWPAVRTLRMADCLLACLLGVIGYLGYFLSVAGAAKFAGPVIAPAFLGLVPVVLALAGNWQRRVVQWRALRMPLAPAVAGLILVNSASPNPVHLDRSESLTVGILLAVAAVVLWTAFGLLNQDALSKRHHIGAGVWTALIMVGGGIGMIVFIPIGLLLRVFEIPRLGLGWQPAAPLYLWGILLAGISSVGGALAWTYAAQRLPVAFSAQLITLETLFGTILGLFVRDRWPTVGESIGMALLLLGVIAVIRLIYHHPLTASQPVSQQTTHPAMPSNPS